MSIFFGWDFREFFEGLFESGLIAIHEMLGTAKALDAVKVVAEGIGCGNEFFKGDLFIVLHNFRQAPNLDSGDGDLIKEFPFNISIEIISFGGTERATIDTKTASVLITRLSATVAIGFGWEGGFGHGRPFG
jgi:hypothetical protein